MKIAFVWSMGGPNAWNDQDLEIGIGGSEAMMILRARAFAELGHEVVCFAPGNTRDPKVFSGVTWRSLGPWPFPVDKSFDFKGEGFDVVVSLRRADWGMTPPPATVLWGNDQGCYDLEAAIAKGTCQKVFTISKFQKELFQRLYPSVGDDKYVVSSAGVWCDDFEDVVEKDPNLCVYMATPERGLRHLLILWRQIIRKHPEAKLVITGGFELYGMSAERAYQLSEGLYGLASYMPNVTVAGVLTHSKLVELQKSASIMAYPSVYDEMCCISALEAHAAGCAIVTTDRAALKERVIDGKTGYLIKGSPGTSSYDKQFVDRVVELLKYPDRCGMMGAAGKEEARNFDHKVLAAQWVKEFKKLT